MSKNILYIGNNLVSKTKYTTTMETLSMLFVDEGFLVIKVSSKLNKFYRLLDMLKSIIKYKSKVDYIIIDTYSTSNFYYAFLTSQLARFFNKRYIPILHGGNLPKRIDKSKNLSKMIFNNSFKNIAPSLYLKTEFEKRNYKVEFIPNVIPIKDYKLKKRVSIKPNLLFVRAFATIYNPKMTVDVLFELKKIYPNAKLCIIGPDRDGSQKEIEDYIKYKGLEKSVEITGVLSKKEWHKKSEEFDVFINTTNIDNTPISVIEAMALGLSVVSTNVGGLPYLIKKNEDGVLVNKNDTKAMVKEINNLIKNPEKAIELTKKARKKAETFDWEIVKYQWKKILG